MFVNSIVKRGDIFYANLGETLGSEQGGIRPVLVIQNDVGNKYSPTVIIAAITSKINKSKLPTHIEVFGENTGLMTQSIVLLEQIRTIDKKRLISKVGFCSEETIKTIDNALLISLGIEIEKQSAYEKINKYMEQEIPFNPDRARRLANTIEGLERFISKYYNEYDELFEIEESIRMHIIELKAYCAKYNVDYRLYYREKKNHLNTIKIKTIGDVMYG